MPTALRDVRSQGQSGKHLLALSFSGFDPIRTLGHMDLRREADIEACRFTPAGSIPRQQKKPQAFTQGNRMRALAAGLVMAASVAIADDIGEARRHALAARDSYWNCLAEKHVSVKSRNMTAQEFALYVGGVCPSERQTFRVMLMHYLAMKFPSIDAGTHLATANNAIELAQKYIVTTFIERQAAPNQ